MELTERCASARRIADEAGELALGYFQRPDRLRIDRKGHQDFVSQADREVERGEQILSAEPFLAH